MTEERNSGNLKERGGINDLHIGKVGVQTIAEAKDKISSESKNWEGEEYSTSSAVELIFSAAVELDASDVHFETSKEGARLRFRLDGILYDVSEIQGNIYDLILSRLKLISGMKINVSNSPQDGRFSMRREDISIDARISTIPAEFGEMVVVRILNPKTIDLKLSDLGMRDDDRVIAENELKKPNGMILVTGPTGSGKTTTLYAFLKEVQDPGSKIITIEDPIEYRLSGIEQTQVSKDGSYDFSNGLKSILRQDPDIIMVGEIRDRDTAETSLNASLTGHLVFSTLHTNNASGAIPRLVDLGINPKIIGPALDLVVAQRLVRRICQKCRKENALSDEQKNDISSFLASLPERVKKPDINEIKIFSSVGCGECEGGYKGRVGIFEFFEVSDKFEVLINNGAAESEIEKTAKEGGMATLQSDGILKALLGETTLEEIERITGPIEWKAGS
ncbi:MAG: type II/IV secretion system protein [Patescibacteria group bacterium]|nr:type II/IV secretion system protein [Patescibacteria group bacterium]